MPLSLEARFRVLGGEPPVLVERLADEVEQAVAGIGEVVGWGLTGSAGHVIVGGDERYEQRLLDQLMTHLGNAAWIEADHIDVEIFGEEVMQATRRIEL